MNINRTNSMYCVDGCCDLSCYNRSTDNDNEINMKFII